MIITTKNPGRRLVDKTAILGIGLGLGLAASGTIAASPEACLDKEGDPAEMVLVLGTTGDPFYLTMKAGALARAEERGVALEIQGAAEWNATLQVPILDSILIRKPDALLLVPNDANALASKARKFVEAGIPIVTVDNTLNDDSLIYSRITADNEQGGGLAAHRLAELSNEKGGVVIIDVGKGNSTTDARANGFMAALAEYPAMEVVSHQYNTNSATKASAQTRASLLANPDVVGVFATNLAGAEGAANGVKASGSSVPVVGYDASPSEVVALKAGTINSLVIQPPALEGATAVDTACSVLAGESVELNIVLDNVIATSENVDDPEIAKFFYLEE